MSELSAIRGLRPLLLAEVASSFALTVQALAVPWLVLLGGGSATQVGLITTVEFAAAITLGLPFGSLVQRVGARRWMICSDLTSATLVSVVAVLAWMDRLPFPLLLGLVFALGSLRTPYMGGQQELLSALAGEGDLLARSTSILQGANRTALLLGSPLAGLLVTALGPASTLALTVIMISGVITLVLTRVPSQPRPFPPAGSPARTAREAAPAGPGADEGPIHPPVRITDGVRELWRDRLVRSWVAGGFLSEAAYQTLFVAIPILTLHRYHATAASAGMLTGAFGAGAVAGSLLATWITTRILPVRVAVAGKTLQALTFAALILPLPLPAAGAVIACLGLANGLTNGPGAAVQIRRLDPQRRGNALTASAAIVMSGGALGSAAAGPALQHRPTFQVFLVATTLLCASCALYAHGARTIQHTEPAHR